MARAGIAVSGTVESRSHDAASSLVPRLVSRALPPVVSIITRQIERDQFNQSVPTRGLGSGVIAGRSSAPISPLMTCGAMIMEDCLEP